MRIGDKVVVEAGAGHGERVVGASRKDQVHDDKGR
jgi:hypothetical protein